MLLRQLHTRAGLEPPYQTTDKRFINTGSGGSGTGTGVIADGYAGSQIFIRLVTQLGFFNPFQSATLNYLLHSAITNTSANNYAGIHWLSDGKIRAIAGASIATRSVTSSQSYAPGDIVDIRWVLSFASITTGLVGTQELFINNVSQGTNNARSDQFAVLGSRFALNSVCADHTSVQTERLTDQYIRLFEIEYADGGYERSWNFDQSSGFEVPNTANAVNDPIKLFGGNGINGIGTNWPQDNSQWVTYGSEQSDLFSSTASVNLPRLGAVVNAQQTAPVFEASTSVNLPRLSSIVTAQVSKPAKTTEISAVLPRLSATVSAAQIPPIYNAQVLTNLPRLTVQSFAESSLPLQQAEASVTLPQIKASALARQLLQADGVVVRGKLPAITAQVYGQVDKPVFQASTSVTLPTLKASIAAETEFDVRLASANITLPKLTLAATVVTVKPIYSAVVGYNLPTLTAKVVIGDYKFNVKAGFHFEIPEMLCHTEVRDLETNININEISTHSEWRE